MVSDCPQLLGIREITMFVQVKFRALTRIKLKEVAIRFLFGGAITAIAGLLAQRFGPALGGLFLAFPAIFPASVTLLVKKQVEKKQKHGLQGNRLGRMAALEARGAIFGCFGLACFGLTVWKLLPEWNSVGVLGVATGLWVAISIGFWGLARKIRHSERRG
jgi:hypothetical protein